MILNVFSSMNIFGYADLKGQKMNFGFYFYFEANTEW